MSSLQFNQSNKKHCVLCQRINVLYMSLPLANQLSGTRYYQVELFRGNTPSLLLHIFDVNM